MTHSQLELFNSLNVLYLYFNNFNLIIYINLVIVVFNNKLLQKLILKLEKLILEN